MVANDKRAWRDFLEQQGGSPHDRQPLSPPVNDSPWTFTGLSPNTLSIRHRHRSRCSSGGSDFEADNGVVLCDTIAQKTLFHLISLLNASYTDYNFTDAKGEDFQRVHEYETVKMCVRSKLAALVRDKRLQQLWSTIEGEIHPKECMIYSYKSDAHMDAFNEDGILWSFNYFFANRRLKRILFLSCQAYRCVCIVCVLSPAQLQRFVCLLRVCSSLLTVLTIVNICRHVQSPAKTRDSRISFK